MLQLSAHDHRPRGQRHCFCSLVFATMFVTLFRVCLLRENGCSHHHNSQDFQNRQQWFWNRAIKFARWQHPAVGYRARFAVTGITCYLICYQSVCVIAVIANFVDNADDVAGLSGWCVLHLWGQQTYTQVFLSICYSCCEILCRFFTPT